MKQCPACKWREERPTKESKFRVVRATVLDGEIVGNITRFDGSVGFNIKVCLNCGALSLWNEELLKPPKKD